METRQALKSLRLSKYRRPSYATIRKSGARTMRPLKYRRPNYASAYYLGSEESPTDDFLQVWLKSSSSDDVASCASGPQVAWTLRPPSLYGRRLSRTVPAVVPAWPAKIFTPCQMFAAANISTFFLGKIKNLTRVISVLSLQFKFVHNHKNCPNSAVTLLSL